MSIWNRRWCGRRLPIMILVEKSTGRRFLTWCAHRAEALVDGGRLPHDQTREVDQGVAHDRNVRLAVGTVEIRYGNKDRLSRTDLFFFSDLNCDRANCFLFICELCVRPYTLKHGRLSFRGNGWFPTYFLAMKPNSAPPFNLSVQIISMPISLGKKTARDTCGTGGSSFLPISLLFFPFPSPYHHCRNGRSLSLPLITRAPLIDERP